MNKVMTAALVGSMMLSSAAMAGARGEAFGKADLFISTDQDLFTTDVITEADKLKIELFTGMTEEVTPTAEVTGYGRF